MLKQENSEFVRINRTEAKNKFSKGQDIFMMADKLRLGNQWVQPMIMSKDASFEENENAFANYNLNDAQTGRRIAFYVKKNNIKEEEMEDYDVKIKLRELKTLSENATRSDLQGVVGADAPKIMEKLNIPINKKEEVENIILNYIDGELDINSAKRYLIDLR